MKPWPLLLTLGLSACVSLPYPQSVCVSGDCLKGAGSLQLADGGRYQGQLVDGYLQGDGSYQAPAEQTRYEGEFANGRFHGRGALVSPQLIFNGEFSEGWPLRGELATAGYKIDVSQFDAGSLSGDYQFGEGFTGSGRFSVYEPQQSDAGLIGITALHRQGSHVIHYPNGERYTAHFVGGQQHGQAVWVSADGKRDRIESWENGNKAADRPGPLALKSAEQAGACRLAKSHSQFVWFGKPCRGGLASGEGVAYAKNNSGDLITGSFRRGELVEGLYQRGDEVFEGPFQQLKLHGLGKHYIDGQLDFSGQLNAGRRGRGTCRVGGNYVSCEHYEGQRIVEEAELVNRNRVDVQHSLAAATRSASNVYAMLGRVSSEASQTFNRRERNWQQAREKEASDRAFNDSMNNAFANMRSSLAEVAEQQRQTNALIAHAQAEQQARQQAQQRDYYAESLARIERQKAQQQQAREQQARQQQLAQARPAVDPDKPRRDCLAKGGEYNAKTRNCVIRVAMGTFAGNNIGTNPVYDGSAQSRQADSHQQTAALAKPSSAGAGDAGPETTPAPSQRKPKKEKPVTVYQEARAICSVYTNKKGIERWWCSGPVQSLILRDNETQDEALKYVGCKTPRRVFGNVRFTEQKGFKLPKGASNHRQFGYACGYPRESYHTDVERIFQVHWPAGVVMLRFNCTGSTYRFKENCNAKPE